MIQNNRQAAVARKKLQALTIAAAEVDAGQKSGYQHLINDLIRELSEYEAIRSGKLTTFQVNGIEDLGDALVRARIAKGWTHRQLSHVLGVSEQMIQKDEARSYERAGLARLADIADGLGYELIGLLRPSEPPTFARVVQTSILTQTAPVDRWMFGPSLVPDIRISVPSQVYQSPFMLTNPARLSTVFSGTMISEDLALLRPSFTDTANTDTSAAVLVDATGALS